MSPPRAWLTNGVHLMLMDVNGDAAELPDSCAALILFHTCIGGHSLRNGGGMRAQLYSQLTGGKLLDFCRIRQECYGLHQHGSRLQCGTCWLCSTAA